MVKDVGLCYRPCKNSAAKGIGPVCWEPCPPNKPTNCGMGCAVSREECAGMIFDQVYSTLEMVFNLVSSAKSASKEATDGVLKKLKRSLKERIVKMFKDNMEDAAKDKLKEDAKDKSRLLTTSIAGISGNKDARPEDIARFAQETTALLVSKPDDDSSVSDKAMDYVWSKIDFLGIKEVYDSYNHPKCYA